MLLCRVSGIDVLRFSPCLCYDTHVMKELIRKNRELIVYFITGVLTTLVNWIVYALQVRVFGWSVALSNATAWAAAVLFAYITNKLWVFRSFNWELRYVLREAALFVGARILTGIFEIVSVPLLVGLGLDAPLLGVRGMWAKILVSAVVMVLNYVFSKLIIFRDSKEPPAGRADTAAGSEDRQ